MHLIFSAFLFPFLGKLAKIWIEKKYTFQHTFYCNFSFKIWTLYWKLSDFHLIWVKESIREIVDKYKKFWINYFSIKNCKSRSSYLAIKKQYMQGLLFTIIVLLDFLSFHCFCFLCFMSYQLFSSLPSEFIEFGGIKTHHFEISTNCKIEVWLKTNPMDNQALIDCKTQQVRLVMLNLLFKICSPYYLI